MATFNLDPAQFLGPAPAAPFDMLAMLQAFMASQQQQQQAQRAAQQDDIRGRAAITNQALGGQTIGKRYGGQLDPITGQDRSDPFSNGFFTSGTVADRRAAMPQTTAGNPYFNAWETQSMAPAPIADSVSPFVASATQMLPLNPATGMPDPRAAQAQLARSMALRRRM